MISLHNLPTIVKRPSKRVGRGYGSGKGGHTTGRGTKGQKARGRIRPWFEGGQKPLHLRVPHKRGFKRAFREEVAIVKIRDLNRFAEGEMITPQRLRDEGLIKKIPSGGVKVLGDGELTKSLTISGLALSEGARQKIVAAGGKIVE